MSTPRKKKKKSGKQEDKESAVSTEVVAAEVVPALSTPVNPEREKSIAFGGEGLREMVLKEAGVTKEELGAIAREGIIKSRELLSAHEVKFAAFKGEITDTLEVEDNKTQLYAARHLMEFAGVMPSRAVEGATRGPGTVNVQIVVPWLGEKKSVQRDEAKP